MGQSHKRGTLASGRDDVTRSSEGHVTDIRADILSWLGFLLLVLGAGNGRDTLSGRRSARLTET